jgi:tRNA dimethylallyltransferase
LAGSETPVVRVVCGPTAAGKTQAALALARLHDVAIVSADSRQLYRGFDVGTAKPTPAERRGAPHFGIDVLDPAERASAAWWADRADGWLREAIDSGRAPVVVGGTGLYLKALFGEFFAEPRMDPVQRHALQAELAPLSTDELRGRVERLDPARAHLGRTQLLRAIEIAELTGQRLSELHRDQRTAPRWRARYLLVDPGPPLAERIAERTRAMLAGGWREEVRQLARTVPAEAPAWNASGYRTIRELEQGRFSTDDAERRVIIETRQYAKRQRTWFRHQLAGQEVTPFDPREPAAGAQLAAWWRGTASEEGA